jgi:hypothetical protein
MMFIKFILSKGDPITLPFEKAETVLTSQQQIVMITDESGKWTGQTINKAHIVVTMRDREAEKDAARDKENKTPKLPEPKSNFSPNNSPAYQAIQARFRKPYKD